MYICPPNRSHGFAVDTSGTKFCISKKKVNVEYLTAANPYMYVTAEGLRTLIRDTKMHDYEKVSKTT